MQRSADIEQLGHRFVDAVTRGDVDALIAWHSTDDAVSVIGTDEGEWASGPEAVAELWRAQPSVPTRLERLDAFEQGDFGFAVGEVVFTLPDGVESRARVTVVLRREQQSWKIVHSHSSVARPA